MQTGVLALYEGRLGTMTDALRSMNAGTVGSNWQAAFGTALLLDGDREAANEIAENFRFPRLNYFWVTTLQSYAELLVGLGRRDLARPVLDALLPFRHQLGVTSSGTACFGLVCRTIGELLLLLGEVDEAVELLEEAVRRADSLSAPFEQTRSRRQLALALIAADRAEEATALIAGAIELATTHGFAGEEHDLLALDRS